MKIKTYDPEKHEEYLPDVHKQNYRSPENVDSFKTAAEEAYEELKSVVNFDDSIEIVVAETDEEEMSEDAPEDHYFHGFSFADGMRGHDGNAIFIRASQEFDWWKDAFKGMLIHETGHQIFYQRDNQDNWEDNQYFSIMFEGHAENLADTMNRNFGYDHSPVWRKQEPIEVDKQQLYKDLDRQRGFGDQDDSKDHDMFLSGGERWDDAEGYIIAYQVARDLLQEDKIELETLINIDSEEWKSLVEESIERLY